MKYYTLITSNFAILLLSMWLLLTIFCFQGYAFVEKKAIIYVYHATQILYSVGGIGKYESLNPKYLKAIQNEKKDYPSIPNTKKDKIKKAIELINKAIKISQSFEEAHFFMGVSYMLKMDAVNAISAFEKALELNIGKESAYTYLFILYVYDNRFIEGHQLVKKYIDKYPNAHEKGVIFDAEIYLSEGKYKESLKIGKKLVKKNSSDIAALYLIAKSYLMMHKDKNADKYFNKIVSLSPSEKKYVLKIKKNFLLKRDKKNGVGPR
jgi:tetratricopeptide (TPR) repeat protein